MDFMFALARTQVSVFDVESHGFHAHGHGVSHVVVRRSSVLLRLPTSRTCRSRVLSRRSVSRSARVRSRARTATHVHVVPPTRPATNGHQFAFVTRSVAVKHNKEQQELEKTKKMEQMRDEEHGDGRGRDVGERKRRWSTVERRW